jgi:hypothetical protein
MMARQVDWRVYIVTKAGRVCYKYGAIFLDEVERMGWTNFATSRCLYGFGFHGS